MLWGIFDPSALPQYFAAALMIGLCVWLLALDPAGRVNRALAIFLALRAFNLTAGTVDAVTTHATVSALALQSAMVTMVLAAVALLHFLAVYPQPSRLFGNPQWGPAALLAFGIVAGTVVLLQPCLTLCKPFGADGPSYWGVLILFNPAFMASIAAFHLLRLFVRMQNGARRESLLLVGGVFALNGLFDGTRNLAILIGRLRHPDGFTASLYAGQIPSPGLWVFMATTMAALVLSVLALGIAAPVLLKRGPTRIRHIALVATTLVAGIYVGLGTAVDIAGLDLAILGLWRVAIPVVVTYAVLRHRVFGLDRRVRFGVSRATLVGAFVFTFVAISEAAPEFLNDVSATPIVGYVSGGVGAALLFFAIGPLQNLSTKFARAAIPGPSRTIEPEAAYRTALEMALCDGRLTPREEHVLARLAVQLDVDVDAALAIREEVERALQETGP